MGKPKKNVKAHTRKVKGKAVHVKAHHRKMYKGYRKGKASYKADRRQHSRNPPAKKFKKGIGHRGDW